MEETAGNNVDIQELQMLVNLTKQLKHDNSILTSNFDVLKAEYVKLTEGHQSLQAKYNKIFEERVAVEKHYQGLCSSWRGELEAKQREFDEARSQIMEPRELELLRLRLMDELEVPHREKCQAFQQEAEKAHGEARRWRLAYEKAQTSVGEGEAERAKEVAFRRTEHAIEVEALKTQLDRVQRQLEDKETECAKMPDLLKELSQNTGLVSHLQSEIKEVREACDAAVEERSKMFVDTQRQVQQAMSDRDAGVRQGEVMSRKVRYLEGELQQASKGNDVLHAQLLRLEQERNTLTLQLHEAMKELQAEKDSMSRNMAAADHEIEEMRQQMKDQTADHEKELSNRESHHKTEMSQKEEEWQNRMEEEAFRTEEQLKKKEEERGLLENKVIKLEAEVKETEKRAKDDLKSLQQEVETLRAQVSGAEETTGKLGGAESELRQVKQELEGLKKETAPLKEQLREYQEQGARLKSELGNLQSSHVEHEVERRHLEETLRAAKDALDRSRADHLSRIEALKGNWELERAVLSRQTAEAVSRQKEKFVKHIKHAKQKMGAYKKAAGKMQKELASAEGRASEYHQALISNLSKTSSALDSKKDSIADEDTYASQLASLKARHTEYMTAAQKTKISK